MTKRKKINSDSNCEITGREEDIRDESEKSGIVGRTPDLSDILNRKWKIFRVSPIYNFNVDKLKRYGAIMSRELNATKKFNSKIIYNCIFSTNDRLKKRENGVNSIKVEISDSQWKKFYCSYFISWAEVEENMEGCISLPILLVECKNSEIEQIHSCLRKMFDCDIQPVTFPFFLLLSLFVNLLQNPRKSTDISKDLLHLEYRIPGCKPTDKMKITLLLQETTIVLAVLIDTLREKFEKIKSREIILEFYTGIANHIYKVYHLDLMLAELYRIEFPDAYITTDGHIKMATEEVALTVLNDLHHSIALDKLIFS